MTTVEKIYNDFISQNNVSSDVKELLKEAIRFSYAEITKGHRMQVKFIGSDNILEPTDYYDFISMCIKDTPSVESSTLTCSIYDTIPNEALGWKTTWIVYQIYPNGDEVPLCYTSDDISKLEK